MDIRDIKKVIKEIYQESDIRNIYFNHDGGFQTIKYHLDYNINNINDVSEFLCETYYYKSSLIHTKFINLFIDKFLKINSNFDSEQFFINCCQKTDEYGKVISNYIKL